MHRIPHAYEQIFVNFLVIQIESGDDSAHNSSPVITESRK
jgi:hypothetical protein